MFALISFSGLSSQTQHCWVAHTMEVTVFATPAGRFKQQKHIFISIYTNRRKSNAYAAHEVLFGWCVLSHCDIYRYRWP